MVSREMFRFPQHDLGWCHHQQQQASQQNTHESESVREEKEKYLAAGRNRETEGVKVGNNLKTKVEMKIFGITNT